MKKIVVVLLVLIMVAQLCACGAYNIKQQLYGNWEHHYKTRISGTIYDYTHFQYLYFYQDNTCDYWDNSATAKKGKFSVNTKNNQIIVKFDEGGTLTIPYAINEYTHELLIFVQRDGTTEWNKK